MRRIALLLLSLILFAGACKKGTDEEPTPDPVATTGGSFTIDGKTYMADYADWSGRNGLRIANLPQAPDYIVNSIEIAIDSLYFSNTFTYRRHNDATYDKKKNFFDALITYTPSGVFGQGRGIAGVTAGNVNVTRKEEIFTVGFDIIVAGKPVTGSYTGKIVGRK
ncbi:hypothetical protein [Chitinophaga rhizophila]|uniref:Lipid-binding hydrolase n=1 Tax=Chitinophaga rhizophila TaxID=2866212 RepID=A0ABS7GJP7_9BACT|nr:hypothetical protein [Chitinophaga rhizophila]MBW8686683.1 hypothetical protein [Chitinophaga rhizophila]